MQHFSPTDISLLQISHPLMRVSASYCTLAGAVNLRDAYLLFTPITLFEWS
jgi:hypothetical protein